jgi:MFS family permease
VAYEATAPTVDRWSRLSQPYLLTAYTISTAGDWLYRLAFPLLVLDLTGSAIGAGLAYALEYLPYILFSLAGGVAADRFDRRTVLWVTDLCSAAVVALLAGLVATGITNILLIFVVGFVVASARPFYHPAMQGLIPALVPPGRLLVVNGRVQLVESIFQFVGPIVGVGAVLALGTTRALWLDALSFLVSACILYLLGRYAAADESPRTSPSVRDDVRTGLAYLRRDRVTLSASVIMAGSCFGQMILAANLIYLLVRVRGEPVGAVAVVFAAFGVGSVLGTLCAPWIGRRFRAGRTIAAMLFWTGVFTALVGVLPGVAGMSAAWAGAGFAEMVVVVTWFSLRQQIVPSELLGRVVAVSRATSFSTIPAGAALGAWMLTQDGAAWTAAGLSGILQAACGLVAFWSPLGSAVMPRAGAGQDAHEG